MTDAPDALQGPLHAALEALAPLAHLAAAGGLRALPAAPRDGQTGGGLVLITPGDRGGGGGG